MYARHLHLFCVNVLLLYQSALPNFHARHDVYCNCSNCLCNANLLVSCHFNRTRIPGVLIHFARAPFEVKFHIRINLSGCRFAQFSTCESTRQRMIFIPWAFCTISQKKARKQEIPTYKKEKIYRIILLATQRLQNAMRHLIRVAHYAFILHITHFALHTYTHYTYRFFFYNI